MTKASRVDEAAGAASASAMATAASATARGGSVTTTRDAANLARVASRSVPRDWHDVVFASLAQAAATSGFGIIVSTLVVATIARTGVRGLGTASLALEFATRSVVSLPLARLATTRGRRVVVAVSGALGVAGALLATVDFFLSTARVPYFLGIALLGVANCASQQLRFVAAAAVVPASQPRALSVGIAGGTIAAFVGPELAKASRTSLEKEYAGSFLAMAGCYAALVMFTLPLREEGPAAAKSASGVSVEGDEEDEPPPTYEEDEPPLPPTPLKQLFRSSFSARKGLACVAVSWAAMFVVMSAAPVAMIKAGHSFDDAATALQYHMILMFLPGLLGTGDCVRVLGPDVVAIAGCALYVACGFFTYAAEGGGGDASSRDGRVSLWVFQAILIALGLAWNLLFVSGSGMMTPAQCSPTLTRAECVRAQGVAETASFGAVAVVAACAGVALDEIGWAALCACLMPLGAGCGTYVLIERARARARGGGGRGGGDLDASARV